jgi:hypothetical protein
MTWGAASAVRDGGRHRGRRGPRCGIGIHCGGEFLPRCGFCLPLVRLKPRILMSCGRTHNRSTFAILVVRAPGPSPVQGVGSRDRGGGASPRTSAGGARVWAAGTPRVAGIPTPTAANPGVGRPDPKRGANPRTPGDGSGRGDCGPSRCTSGFGEWRESSNRSTFVIFRDRLPRRTGQPRARPGQRADVTGSAENFAAAG